MFCAYVNNLLSGNMFCLGQTTCLLVSIAQIDICMVGNYPNILGKYCFNARLGKWIWERQGGFNKKHGWSCLIIAGGGLGASPHHISPYARVCVCAYTHLAWYAYMHTHFSGISFWYFFFASHGGMAYVQAASLGDS